ncbi:Pr6Pr family membrane protein [Glutamicibacter sp.]|uniref:Pr6Pr family membrane protein n=1 Tax=Glutamicibacter sp. TaxID=1931995 RepID=UPI0028BD174A|nr:Pr6Pr family membrane protein [Glutamicibacter sp.]
MTEVHPGAWFGWLIARALIGMAIIAAIAAQAQATMAFTVALQRDLTTTMVNFFSYFTILSNLLCAIALLTASTWMAVRTPGAQEPRWLARLLACAATYMIITGLVYNLLLRSIALDQGTTVPWSNEILHTIGPAYMLIDSLFARSTRALPWKDASIALAFPLFWLIYTFIRGPLTIAPATGLPWWYPYPFLNPHIQGGWAPVLGYVVGIAALIVAAAFLVIAMGRRPRGARTSQPVRD